MKKRVDGTFSRSWFRQDSDYVCFSQSSLELDFNENASEAIVVINGRIRT